jgi:transposase, IS5 family
MAQIPRQTELFAQTIRAKIVVSEDHELVRLERALDWDELIESAMDIRSKKIKAATGPEPHYRELLGAVTLMAVKNITYRDAEDLIAHYAPARYLCNLMESDWRPDHITIFEFTQMLGEAGMSKVNGNVLGTAKDAGILDPTHLMSDTTAQEAKIPYPNEVGLMSRYAGIVKKSVRWAGKAFSKVRAKAKEVEKKIKGLVRASHLFAKTKEQKRKVGKKLYHVSMEIHRELLKAIKNGAAITGNSRQELARITEIMKTLFPQIKHFIETGFVAPKKIIHLKMSELYAIVRGKAGKSVEFGLKWGISRIGGGFVQGFLINDGEHCSDKRFCLEAIRVHQSTHGNAPDVFGFDRGGYSKINIKKAKKMGVKHVGIAPTGKASWDCSAAMEKKIKRERAQVEGSIGTIKSPIYGFNKPNARSVRAMGTYGQRAILGFNMRKLVREQLKLRMATA